MQFATNKTEEETMKQLKATMQLLLLVRSLRCTFLVIYIFCEVENELLFVRLFTHILGHLNVSTKNEFSILSFAKRK